MTWHPLRHIHLTMLCQSARDRAIIMKERVSVVHIGDARKLLETKEAEEVAINEIFNSSIKIDEDDCYYTFIRLYTPNGKKFGDSAIVPILELKSIEKVRLCLKI